MLPVSKNNRSHHSEARCATGYALGWLGFDCSPHASTSPQAHAALQWLQGLIVPG
ncbi:hypothetical protein [Synechococcus sp. UW140]|uniref:hypothetical protein n=1 Tax=Synechococcus sp. UW140 TaxID=368503 RepID=UPI003137AC77